jgi:hypothetical protein
MRFISSDVDATMVEDLVKGASLGMSDAAIPEITTHAEVLSAAFTFLDRTLRSVRKLQSLDDRFEHAEQISKALNELLVDHGKVPS